MGAKGTSFLVFIGILLGMVSTAGYMTGVFSQIAYRTEGAITVALLLWAVSERIRTEKYVKAATKEKRICVFLPLYAWWAKVLLYLFGGADMKMEKGAYEIHINPREAKGVSPRDFMQRLETGLDLVKAEHTGVYLWESPMKPPRSYRESIKKMRGEKTALLLNRCERESVGTFKYRLFKILVFFQPELRKVRSKPIWMGVFVNS